MATSPKADDWVEESALSGMPGHATTADDNDLAEGTIEAVSWLAQLTMLWEEASPAERRTYAKRILRIKALAAGLEDPPPASEPVGFKAPPARRKKRK